MDADRNIGYIPVYVLANRSNDHDYDMSPIRSTELFPKTVVFGEH